MNHQKYLTQISFKIALFVDILYAIVNYSTWYIVRVLYILLSWKEKKEVSLCLSPIEQIMHLVIMLPIISRSQFSLRKSLVLLKSILRIISQICRY
jgi:hypothetical protein